MTTTESIAYWVGSTTTWTSAGPLVVTPTRTPHMGVWLVHRAGQCPVEGVAVYQYADPKRTWVCERCGDRRCEHVQAVQKHEGTAA